MENAHVASQPIQKRGLPLFPPAALKAAKRPSVDARAMKQARALQRKAQWRVDFINAENSMGFHAPQESARVLGEAIDYARQGQIKILRSK